jgi:hypothetical protein
MPVENIHADGTLMFNTKGEGALSESNYSFYGQIHEDDEFSEADLEAIKNKKGALAKQLRYLSDNQAKAKRADRAELEGLNVDEMNRLSDSTGVEPPKDADETVSEKQSPQEIVEERKDDLAEDANKSPVVDKSASKPAAAKK